MNNEYPTEETLQAIREWPFENLPALFDRLKQEWWNAEWGWSQDGWKFSVSTGGWSGNEELIDALQANAMVWGLVWLSSRRGGHFEFEIPQNFRHAPKPTIAQQLAPALRDAERVAGNLAATLKPKE